jgi:hypothetical protein
MQTAEKSNKVSKISLIILISVGHYLYTVNIACFFRMRLTTHIACLSLKARMFLRYKEAH